jgi:hypothetical protein
VIRVEAASRAPHGRKHGSTFADSWRAPDGSTIGAVAAVLAGRDTVAVSDLLRTGAHAVLTSRATLDAALAALDRIVRTHARDQRDDELAAAMLLVAVEPSGDQLSWAGAGQLHAALIDGGGTAHPLYGHAAALGTGVEPMDLIQRVRLRRDDALVAATVPFPAGWWGTTAPSAETLLVRAGAPEASALLVLP